MSEILLKGMPFDAYTACFDFDGDCFDDQLTT